MPAILKRRVIDPSTLCGRLSHPWKATKTYTAIRWSGRAIRQSARARHWLEVLPRPSEVPLPLAALPESLLMAETDALDRPITRPSSFLTMLLKRPV